MAKSACPSLFVSIHNHQPVHPGEKIMNNRRDFIKSSAAVTAMGAASTLGFNIKSSAANVKSPNDTIRVAVVGFHAQGGAHIREYAKMQNVEIAALCDIDDSVRAKGCQDVEKLTGKKPKDYVDVRKLLEDKSIDAISIAT